MSKQTFNLFLQLVGVIVLYGVLQYFIENLYILLAVFIGIFIILLVVRAIFVRNHADVLEITVSPENHYEKIKKFETKDKNKYHTLLAYGKSFEGKFDEAQRELDKVEYEDIKTSKNLKFSYTVTKLHILYNNKDRNGYQSLYDQAVSEKVFDKVSMQKETFEVPILILDGLNETAEKILVSLIPQTPKRIFIIELEYFLALAYFNQDKFEDCKAVCDFIEDKKYPIIYTQYCADLNKKIPKE